MGIRLQTTADRMRAAIALCGGLAAALALMVLIGWHTQSVALVQVLPTFVPMQYNTALGFLFSGAGLLLLLSDRKALKTTCGISVVAIGFLTLIEYVLKADLGIDLFFIDPFTTVKTPYPGRMSPNSALSFLLTGIAFLIAGQSSGSKKRPLLVGFLSSIIITMGVVSFMGYLGGMDTIYSWGWQLSGMAIHTSAGFAMLGGGTFIYAWCESARDSKGMPRWLAIPVGIVGVTASIVFWQALVQQERAQIFGTAEAEIGKSFLPEIALLVGLLTSLSMALAVRFGQTAQLRANQAELAKEGLKHEVKERKRAEEELKALNDTLEQRVNERTSELEASRLKAVEMMEEAESARIKAESANEDLKRAEAKFRNLLESAPDAMVIVDKEGIIRLVNAQTERLFGFSRDELLGQYVEMLIPEELRKAHIGYRKDFFSNPQLRPMGAGRELFGLHKDGSKLAVEISLSPLETDERTVVLGAVRDITERRRSEYEIRKLNDELIGRTVQLETANKELEAFSYSVSHDLRAPLRHMNGFVNALKRNGIHSLDEKSRRYIDIIAESSERMGTLIDDLLTFSRMGRIEIRYRKISLDKLVQEVIKEFEPEASGRRIKWIVGNLPETTGDSSLLRQVFTNLIENALKFTRKKEEARIEIGSVGREDKDLIQENDSVFFVRDNGVGFDSRYIDKLFGVFQRLHPQDEFEGTGIGLANVRRIIHRHGGHAWAEGALDEGACFYVTLPKQHELHITPSPKELDSV